jgi:dynein heavy chain 1
MMAGQVAIAEVNGNGVPNQITPDLDPLTLAHHLSRLLDVTLGATHDELHQSDSLLGSPKIEETLKVCSRFAQESKPASLYIQKLRKASSRTEADGEANGTSSATVVVEFCSMLTPDH